MLIYDTKYNILYAMNYTHCGIFFSVHLKTIQNVRDAISSHSYLWEQTVRIRLIYESNAADWTTAKIDSINNF